MTTRVCPWYKQGYCVSPFLKSPSDLVVSTRRCLAEYKTCKYYKDNSASSPVGLEKFQETQQKSKTFISDFMVPEIYSQETEPQSQCEYFAVTIYDRKYYTYCNAKRSWLTKSMSSLCSSHYHDCPWREL